MANRWFLAAEWENPRTDGSCRLNGKTRTLVKRKGAAPKCRLCAVTWENGLGVGDFYAGGAEDFAFVGLLDEGDDSEIFGVRVGLQFDGYVL